MCVCLHFYCLLFNNYSFTAATKRSRRIFETPFTSAILSPFWCLLLMLSFVMQISIEFQQKIEFLIWQTDILKNIIHKNNDVTLRSPSHAMLKQILASFMRKFPKYFLNGILILNEEITLRKFPVVGNRQCRHNF